MENRMDASIKDRLSDEGRMEALKKAAQMRTARAAVKARLKAGELKFSDLLSSDSRVITGMRVRQAIAALPGYGTAKTDRLLADVGIAEGRRIGGLGARQKRYLAEVLG